MKRTLFAFVFLSSVISSKSLHADPLNNFIAPAIGGGFYNETKDSSRINETLVRGVRYRLSADFVSLHNNVSVYPFVDFGTYINFGAQLRVFGHSISESRGGSGLIYGLGAGYSYSPGIEPRVAFAELCITAFFRVLLDTEKEWGFFIEGSYEAALNRDFKDFDAPDKGTDHRFFLALGIPISTNW